MKFTELFYNSMVVSNFKDILNTADIDKVNLNKEQRKVDVILTCTEIIKKSIILEIAKDVKDIYGLRVIKILTKYPKELFGESYFEEILYYIEKKYPHLYYFLEGSTMSVSGDMVDIFLKDNGVDILGYNGLDSSICELIKDEFDLTIKVNFIANKKQETKEDAIKKEHESNEIIRKKLEESLAKKAEITAQAPTQPEQVNGEYKYKKFNFEKYAISDITYETGKVEVTGDVFMVERRDFNNSPKGSLNYYITDYKSSVICKVIAKREELDELEGQFKKGDYVTISGETLYDKYINETIIDFKTKYIEKSYKEEKQDNASEKRCELHLHTNMSAIDGVNPIEDYITLAKKWGHKSIAVTDHGVVQAFPDAYSCAKKNDIKLIYGVEGYLINDIISIMSGEMQDYSLDDEFIIFDLETTGFSPINDKITEIGAVKMKNGEIIDRFSTFVNPKIPIPYKIVELTGITDDMVKDAPDVSQALMDFMKFCGDSPFVAHNASFDIGFVTQKLKDMNLEFKPVYIDTVEMSRTLLPELSKHKLNLVCKHLGVSLEGHHRAVNDAEALAEVFKKFIEKLKAKNINFIHEINSNAHTDEKDLTKLRANHIILLVQNKEGLKNLYKLISKSHLDHFYRNPRIPKSQLIKYREGLIIGSACEAGELYRAILKGQPYDEIISIAKFYDYLEIQPLGNNQYLIDNGTLKSREDLIKINMEIIKLGKKLDKKVVATGDVHFLDEKGGLYRAILMAGKKFKDADNQPPLYYRTTNEMLDEFTYLSPDDAYDVVIANPNSIADLIEENFEPIPSLKHPPVIEGAAEDIEAMTYKKAYELYGDPLPELVKKRIEKELNSIINNGFSVMYLIAQKLVTKSLMDGYLVGSRGSVGSSFVAFLSDITEVNSLCAHYICPKCKYSEFVEDGSYSSGCDMPDKKCPECEGELKKDGHDIPFETFLGFDGDKEPDIDLNFSGEYQGVAHKYVEELFGEGHVFRAGTIGTIADKTAYGYVKNYFNERDKMLNLAEINRLTVACTGAKATTGQHPGGIIIVPKEDDVYDFTPIQHPANDKSSGIITTHFDYHKLHDTLLKLDILGHDDPTMLRMLEDLTGLDPTAISLDDAETMSLFKSPKALNVTEDEIGSKTGTFGVPEFGTKFVRQMLEDTKPETFAELVRISGLSHGTDVWLNNAQEIVKTGVAELKDTICTRDDIMIYLMHKGLPPKRAFTIMEQVRKGKGLKEQDILEMREHDVPQWYIDSCIKIKYMFPKAHAVAYVTMGFRVAYYKVHYPLEYYCAYYSVRADDFDAVLMTKGQEKVKDLLKGYANNPNPSAKEKNIITILEICNEMYSRKIDFLPVDIYKSDAENFLIEDGKLRPPLTSIKGLGLSVAQSVVEAREKEEFFTKEDFLSRTKAGSSIVELLSEYGCFEGMPDSSQISLF